MQTYTFRQRKPIPRFEWVFTALQAQPNGQVCAHVLCKALQEMETGRSWTIADVCAAFNTAFLHTHAECVNFRKSIGNAGIRTFRIVRQQPKTHAA